jgi:hypothetical protein
MKRHLFHPRWINGQEYHLCDPALQCRADMMAAVIEEATVQEHTAKVLTMNPEEAKRILRDDLMERGIIEEY